MMNATAEILHCSYIIITMNTNHKQLSVSSSLRVLVGREWDVCFSVSLLCSLSVWPRAELHGQSRECALQLHSHQLRQCWEVPHCRLAVWVCLFALVRNSKQSENNILLLWFTALFSLPPVPLYFHTLACSTTAALSLTRALSSLWCRWAGEEGPTFVFTNSNRQILHSMPLMMAPFHFARKSCYWASMHIINAVTLVHLNVMQPLLIWLHLCLASQNVCHGNDL